MLPTEAGNAPGDPMRSRAGVDPATAGGMAAPLSSQAHRADMARPTACLNCGATLHGRYCADCGQAADHPRTIVHLLRESLEGLIHLDGRLAQTLPLLFFHPGRLARDRMEGRRARHVPPFRLFLVSLLLFMLALEVTVDGVSAGRTMTVTTHNGATTKVLQATPRQMAAILSGEKTPEQVADGDDEERPGTTMRRAEPRLWNDPRAWMGERVERALAHPEYFELLVFTWAHRLAILLLPIFALQLTMLYARHGLFHAHDHLTVAMQFLSFVFLVTGLAWLPPEPLRSPLLTAAALWMPVNLYQLLRGAYGTGVTGALARTAWLWFSTQILFALLVLGLLVLSLQRL